MIVTAPPSVLSAGLRCTVCIAAIIFAGLAGMVAAAEVQHPTLPFDVSKLKLIDEVDLGAKDPGHGFQVFPDAKVIEHKKILGREALVLPNPEGALDRYVAVRLGEGKGLEYGKTYILQIEYPEDAPRSMIIWNTGNETSRAFHTGSALGDGLKMPYVTSNAESLSYPLSNEWRNWTSVFQLHQRFSELKRVGERPMTPKDGFTVALAHYKYENDPSSQGLAVGKIRLYAAPEASVLELPIKRPPAGLPERHLFWREEMSDGVISQRNAKTPGFDRKNMVDWYEAKVNLMKFLGMDTLSKDLLEFGHNQGWDSAKFGGNDWVYQSDNPNLWHDIVALAAKRGVNILPMYEYAGSMGTNGLGPQKRSKTLAQAGKGPKGRDDYTHIHWSEKGNVDVTDPDTFEDFRKMLEITIADEADRARILGAWIRPRNSGIPVSFSDQCLEMFAKESKQAKTPTREDLQKDKRLYGLYIEWWHGKRCEFLLAVRDYLRQPEVLGKDAVVIFTGDPTEPGRVLKGGGIVTDDPSRFPGEKTLKPEDVLRQRLNWQELTTAQGTWGGWEWQHSIPRNDPELYKETPGVMLSMAFNRLYTVADQKALEAFETPDGLAMMRHYPLNENCFIDSKNRPLGYFVVDFEMAGPYIMLAEARALANGNPRFIGYLASNSFQRGFPEYVRAFNQAFLALPALPSKRLDNASSDKEVVVREIATEKHGTWYAVINTSMNDAKGVKISLGKNKLTDYLTDKPVKLSGDSATVSLYPGQVLVWHAAP